MPSRGNNGSKTGKYSTFLFRCERWLRTSQGNRHELGSFHFVIVFLSERQVCNILIEFLHVYSSLAKSDHLYILKNTHFDGLITKYRQCFDWHQYILVANFWQERTKSENDFQSDSWFENENVFSFTHHMHEYRKSFEFLAVMIFLINNLLKYTKPIAVFKKVNNFALMVVVTFY